MCNIISTVEGEFTHLVVLEKANEITRFDKLMDNTILKYFGNIAKRIPVSYSRRI